MENQNNQDGIRKKVTSTGLYSCYVLIPKKILDSLEIKEDSYVEISKGENCGENCIIIKKAKL